MKRVIPASRTPGAGTVRKAPLASLIVTVLVPLLVSSLPVYLAAQDAHRDETGGERSFEGLFASDLVLEAHRLIAMEERDHARFLLERAHSINPQSGDALYLLATLERHAPDTVQWREQLLRRALELHLESISPDDLTADLARLLIDTHRAAEAVDLLDTHLRQQEGRGAVHRAMAALLEGDTEEPGESAQRTLSRLESLFIEAILGDNPGWFSTALLARMRSRYPEDMNLALLDWRRFDTLVPSFSEWLGPVLDRADEFSLSEELHALREITGRFLSLLPEESGRLRTDLTRQYYEMLDGVDPRPALLVLLLSSPDEVPSFVRDFSFPEDSKELWEVLGSHRDPGDWPENLPQPLGSLLEDLLSRTTAVIHHRDTVTFTGEAYHLEGGVLRRWIRDSDGNGRTDKVVEFRGGGNLSLYERNHDTVVRVDYAPYPLVTRVWSFPLLGEGVQRWTVLERERIDSGTSRVWSPAGPVPFDPGLQGPIAGASGASVLAGTITVDRSIHRRFSRQLASDDANTLSPVVEREETRYLRSVGMMR